MNTALTHRQLTEKILTELLSLKEYVYTKVITRSDLRESENLVMSHIDGLYKKTDTLDHETAANRSRSERLESRVSRIETHVGQS